MPAARRSAPRFAKHAGGVRRTTGMMLAADYARAVAYLDPARLPAYVSFVEQASTRGIARDREASGPIYVRISDGAIVSGLPPADGHAIQSNNGDSDNPFRKHGFFDPQCYVPKSENDTRWNGQAAVRFELQSVCTKDDGIGELYADPQTLRPIAVDGNVVDTGDANVTVAMELRYTTIDRYTVPLSIRAHAVGHGWLLWVRERVEVDYTDYQFYKTTEFMRKQASKARPAE